MISTELTELLKDSNLQEADRQTLLWSLRELADKGDLEGEARPRQYLTFLRGDLRNLSFTAVFYHCCQAGWSEEAFELWGRWRAIPRNILGGLDATGPSLRSLPVWCVVYLPDSVYDLFWQMTKPA